jgi:hypothetical protein
MREIGGVGYRTRRPVRGPLGYKAVVERDDVGSWYRCWSVLWLYSTGLIPDGRRWLVMGGGKDNLEEGIESTPTRACYQRRLRWPQHNWKGVSRGRSSPLVAAVYSTLQGYNTRQIHIMALKSDPIIKFSSSMVSYMRSSPTSALISPTRDFQTQIPPRRQQPELQPHAMCSQFTFAVPPSQDEPPLPDNE